MPTAREPRKESKSLRRLYDKAACDEHFQHLMDDIKKAMVTHLASPSDVRKAATLVAYNYTWELYGMQQRTCKIKEEPGHVLEDDKDEEEGEGPPA